MNSKRKRSRLERGIVPLLCIGFLGAGAPEKARALNDTAPVSDPVPREDIDPAAIKALGAEALVADNDAEPMMESQVAALDTTPAEDIDPAAEKSLGAEAIVAANDTGAQNANSSAANDAMPTIAAPEIMINQVEGGSWQSTQSSQSTQSTQTTQSAQLIADAVPPVNPSMAMDPGTDSDPNADANSEIAAAYSQTGAPDEANPDSDPSAQANAEVAAAFSPGTDTPPPPISTGTDTDPADVMPIPAPASEPLPGDDYSSKLKPDQATMEVADAVPLPANPALEEQFDQYDLVGLETPLFSREGIDEFAQRPQLVSGPWSINFHLSVDNIYDGNIFLRQSNEQADFITRIEPGVSVRLGDTDSLFYLFADYSPALNLYDTHVSESTFDQDFSTSFQWNLAKTTVTVRGGVYDNSGQDVDVTDLVQQELYDAGVTVHYQYSDKTSTDFSTDYSRSDFRGLISSSQYEAQFFLNYDYSPKTQFGFGGTGGFMEVPGGSDQTFEQANLRISNRTTGKLTLIAEGGINFQQADLGGGQMVTPIFSIEAAWAAREGTNIDLSLQRQIFAAAILQDQDYVATAANLGITQRITSSWDASLNLGYVNTTYESVAAGVSASREDNVFFIRPGIEWHALSWLSLGLFYEYSQDTSNSSINSFKRDRAGIETAIRF